MSNPAAADSRAVFLGAAESFVRQVGDLPLDRYTEAGLGDWNLRALVGHTSRSLVTMDTYLDQPAESVAYPTAAAYYAAIAAATFGKVDVDHAAVTARGVAAGEALGEDPVGYVTELLASVRRKLGEHEPSYVMTTIGGGMTVAEYLRTRIFELVVHGYDIERASGVPTSYDEVALVDAATLAAEVCVVTGRGPELLTAVTGRGSLSEGFSIV